MTLQQKPPTGSWRVSQPADIVAWRARRLCDGGYDPDLALVLATQRVDLHALLQLVDAGCRPDLAARIMSADDDTGVTR
jgi:hypothetical protein